MTLSLPLFAAALLQSPAAAACPIVENWTIVAFESGSAEFSAPSRQLLEGWSRIIQSQRFPARVELIGSADRVGSRRANLRLSLERAGAVRDYLVSRGVPGDRISVRAVGEARPLVDTADEVPEAQNRIVQLLMIPDPREPRPC